MRRVTQRIEIADPGITITVSEDPLMSMYGHEMMPGTSRVFDLPWEEIMRVSISAVEYPPGFEREFVLIVDLTWGEYFELRQDSDGFGDAVAQLARRSGIAVPDLAVVSSREVLAIWTRIDSGRDGSA